MALKAKETEAKDTPMQGKATPDTMVLELAMYTNYMRDGVSYEKGKQYRFKREDALALLEEYDMGRPIWKVFHPVVVKKAEPVTVDHTNLKVHRVIEPVPGEVSRNRVEIGDESEIAELMGNEDNVTV